MQTTEVRKILIKKYNDSKIAESENSYKKTKDVIDFENSPLFHYFSQFCPDKKAWDKARASEFVLFFADNGKRLDDINNSSLSNAQKLKEKASFYQEMFEKYRISRSKVEMPICEYKRDIEDENLQNNGIKILKSLCNIRKIEYIRDVASKIINDEIETKIKGECGLGLLERRNKAVDLFNKNVDLSTLSHCSGKNIGFGAKLKITLLNALAPFFTKEDINMSNHILEMKYNVEMQANKLGKKYGILSSYKDRKELKNIFDNLEEKERGVLVSQLNATTLKKVCSLGKKYRTMVENTHSALAPLIEEKELYCEQ